MSDARVKGLKELNAFLQQLPAKVEQNVLRGALRAGVKVIHPVAVANVPVKSGLLRDGIKYGVGRGKPGTVIARVRVTGKHAFIAPWLEFGVAAHNVAARKGGWLFFGGLFAKSIDHPGFAPRPFLRPALDSQAQNAVVAAAQYMKKRLDSKHGLDTSDVEIEAL